MDARDPAKIRTLFEHLHSLRQRAEDMPIREVGKMGWEGSGISVFIPQFNRLLARAKNLLSDDPALAEATEGIGDTHELEEYLHPSYHRKAQQELLIGSDLLIQALASYLAPPTPGIRLEREGVFVAGQHFDALLMVADLISQAKQGIILVDETSATRYLSFFAARERQSPCKY